MTYSTSTGRAAALTRWALEPDRARATQAARDGRRRRYADRVDPDRAMTDLERDRRIDALVRADMITLAARRRAR
jgi:hypothetical protein